MEADLRAERPGNAVHHVRWSHRLFWMMCSLISGMLASACFPPLEFSWLVWISLIPILWIGFRMHSRPFLYGYLFGFGHFATTYFWLNEVFILASVGLAAIYAFIPAIWLSSSRIALRYLSVSEEEELFPRNDPAVSVENQLTPSRICFLIVFMSCFWCGLEWCRSWFLTGFPWNQLGISQWQNHVLLPMVQFTGVYGISFMIVIVNASFYFLAKHMMDMRIKPIDAKSLIWFLSPVVVCSLVIAVWYISAPKMSEDYDEMSIAAVQGNIPQSRVWTQEQLDLAIDVYTGLTRDIVQSEKPDLVVWPETAIPASLLYNEQCKLALGALQKDIKTSLIAGTIDYRFSPDAHKTGELPRSFNSCIYFDEQGRILDWYDKIHLVPFGEYVPFERYFPQLNDMIGMGRSLSGGREHTVMTVQDDARIGFNICYEDIFPEISRWMVLNGANLLLIVTNDAWFGESPGSRQHLTHAVFRAVENFRPILRNGNNSDTCLIMPNGTLIDPIRDGIGGAVFTRKAQVYHVPLWSSLPLTFYTRYGNVFAVLCFVISALGLFWCFMRYLNKKRKLYELIRDEETVVS